MSAMAVRRQRLAEARGALRIAAQRVLALSPEIVAPDEMQELADAYAVEYGDTAKVTARRRRAMQS